VVRRSSDSSLGIYRWAFEPLSLSDDARRATHHTSMGSITEMAFWAFIGSSACCHALISTLSDLKEERRRAVPATDPNIPFTSVSTFDCMSSLMMVLALAGAAGDMNGGRSGCFSTAPLGLVFLRQ